MKDRKPVGLYIHIPFCAQKCFYCDFASYQGKNHLVEEYLQALGKEIQVKTEGQVFDTIFIGGGTPSYLSCEELELLGSYLMPLQKTAEVEFSMECNPGNLTKEKAEVIQKMGVNRLSIGLQSSNDAILLDIGRIHTFGEFEENFHMLRELGFENINVDLIYGLPHENLSILEKTLADVLALKPDHISCYSLIIEEFTPFFYKAQRNQLVLPDEETERTMHETIVAHLSGAGYHRYEISNYALAEKMCKHNIRYWQGEEYIGCGTSAHEYFQGTRKENVRTIEGYIRKMSAQGSAATRIHENSKEEDMEEYIFMGMRMMEGIDKKRFYQRFSVELHEIYGPIIKKYIAEGLLQETATSLKFTEKGVEFSNLVLSDFLLTV